jgi:hypothetical protein
MLLRVRDLRRERHGHFVAITLNKGDVPVSDDDAQLIQAVLERSDAELEPLIATRDPIFPMPEAVPVEIENPAAA